MIQEHPKKKGYGLINQPSDRSPFLFFFNISD